MQKPSVQPREIADYRLGIFLDDAMHIFFERVAFSSHSPLPPRTAAHNTRCMDHETSPRRCMLGFWPALPLVCIFFFFWKRGFHNCSLVIFPNNQTGLSSNFAFFRFLHLACLFNCEVFHSSFKFDAYPHRFQVRAQLIEVALTPS